MTETRPKINIPLLKEHVAKFHINPQTSTEFHKQMFTLHPETATYFDAEDLDVDLLHKSRKMAHIGAGITRSIFSLVNDYEDDRNWHGAVKNLIISHKEYSVPLEAFKKGLPAVLAMMKEKAGGCTEEQAKEWTALFEQCFKDMEVYGYQ